ncbi:MAG: hypothetical protein V1740_03230 [Candidatus Woesearchaeota archaeon]
MAITSTDTRAEVWDEIHNLLEKRNIHSYRNAISLATIDYRSRVDGSDSGRSSGIEGSRRDISHLLAISTSLYHHHNDNGLNAVVNALAELYRVPVRDAQQLNPGEDPEAYLDRRTDEYLRINDNFVIKCQAQIEAMKEFRARLGYDPAKEEDKIKIDEEWTKQPDSATPSPAAKWSKEYNDRIRAKLAKTDPIYELLNYGKRTRT